MQGKLFLFFYFLHRVVSACSALPGVVVELGAVVEFKRLLDGHVGLEGGSKEICLNWHHV